MWFPQSESVVSHFCIYRRLAQRIIIKKKKKLSMNASCCLTAWRNVLRWVKTPLTFIKCWSSQSGSFLVPNDCKTPHCCCFPSDSLDEGTAEWGQRKKRRVFGTNSAGEWPRWLTFFLSFCLPLFFPPHFVCFFSCFYNLWVMTLFEIVNGTRWERMLRPKINPWMFDSLC